MASGGQVRVLGEVTVALRIEQVAHMLRKQGARQLDLEEGPRPYGRRNKGMHRYEVEFVAPSPERADAIIALLDITVSSYSDNVPE